MIHPKTMTTSDFNLEKINTKELSEHIAASIQVGSSIAIFGRRGSGKTAIAKQEIKKSGLTEVYVNLAVFERPDMGGWPRLFSTEPTKFVEFLLPNFYKSLIEGDKGAVVLFDELDKCDPSVLAPLLEFVQFHSINHRDLPNLCSVIMTGNLISEGGSRPSPPLLDRVEKYLVEADLDSLLEWSGKTGRLHPAIIAYLKDNSKDLFGAVDPEDRYADPSPRGWDRSSDILYKGEEMGWSTDLLNKKVCGCIGKEAGIKYAIYYEHYQQLLPMIEELFEGKDIIKQYQSLTPSKQLVACMIACNRLVSLLDKIPATETEKGLKYLPPPPHKYIANFLQKVSYENVLVAIRSTITTQRLVKFNLDNEPDWRPFLREITKEVGF
jgi:hypothetical protein